jgi:membrane-associated phospholipid phosphatase
MSSPDPTATLAFDGSQIDGSLYTQVTNFARDTSWLNGTLTGYSSYGVGLFAVLIVLAWWAARRAGTAAMTAALAVPVAAVLAYVVNAVVKVVVAEPRPCFAYPADFLLEACPAPSDYAFPSNHSVVVAAMTIALVFVSRRLAVVAAVAAVLMGFTRVYVGAHYPHDVLAGLLIGTVVGYLTAVTARRYAIPLLDRLLDTRLRPLLSASPPHASHNSGDGR